MDKKAQKTENPDHFCSDRGLFTYFFTLFISFDLHQAYFHW